VLVCVLSRGLCECWVRRACVFLVCVVCVMCLWCVFKCVFVCGVFNMFV